VTINGDFWLPEAGYGLLRHSPAGSAPSVQCFRIGRSQPGCELLLRFHDLRDVRVSTLPILQNPFVCGLGLLDLAFSLESLSEMVLRQRIVGIELQNAPGIRRSFI